jgi:ribosomal protein L37E
MANANVPSVCARCGKTGYTEDDQLAAIEESDWPAVELPILEPPLYAIGDDAQVCHGCLDEDERRIHAEQCSRCGKQGDVTRGDLALEPGWLEQSTPIGVRLICPGCTTAPEDAAATIDMLQMFETHVGGVPRLLDDERKRLAERQRASGDLATLLDDGVES